MAIKETELSKVDNEILNRYQKRREILTSAAYNELNKGELDNHSFFSKNTVKAREKSDATFQKLKGDLSNEQKDKLDLLGDSILEYESNAFDDFFVEGFIRGYLYKFNSVPITRSKQLLDSPYFREVYDSHVKKYNRFTEILEEYQIGVALFRDVVNAQVELELLKKEM